MINVILWNMRLFKKIQILGKLQSMDASSKQKGNKVLPPCLSRVTAIPTFLQGFREACKALGPCYKASTQTQVSSFSFPRGKERHIFIHKNHTFFSNRKERIKEGDINISFTLLFNDNNMFNVFLQIESGRIVYTQILSLICEYRETIFGRPFAHIKQKHNSYDKKLRKAR